MIRRSPPVRSCLPDHGARSDVKEGEVRQKWALLVIVWLVAIVCMIVGAVNDDDLYWLLVAGAVLFLLAAVVAYLDRERLKR